MRRYDRRVSGLAGSVVAAGFLFLSCFPARAGAAAFQWTSTAPLILPKPDAAHDTLAVKDPSVVHVNGNYHVFMTTADSKGWHIAYTRFKDWSEASTAPVTYLDRSEIGPGYRAAPQVFYFSPQHLWYLIFQGGDPMYGLTELGLPTCMIPLLLGLSFHAGCGVIESQTMRIVGLSIPRSLRRVV